MDLQLMRSQFVLFWIFCFLFSACASINDPTDNSDTSTNSGLDGGMDSGIDSGPDTSSDVDTDTDTDTDSDADTDADSDSDTDTDIDAGSDSGSDAGDTETCTPDCAGKCAGADDGCNGTCSADDCPNCCDSTCCPDAGVCYDAGCCTPSCAVGQECGDNGCGGSCGECDALPENDCFSMSIMLHYEDPGTCNTDMCEYVGTQFTCPAGTCETTGGTTGNKQCYGSSPLGSIYSALWDQGIRGWACDPDIPWESSKIRIYFNATDPENPSTGVFGGEYVAKDSSNATVTADCGGGSYHNYTIKDAVTTAGLGPGTHDVHVWAINVGGDTTALATRLEPQDLTIVVP